MKSLDENVKKETLPYNTTKDNVKKLNPVNDFIKIYWIKKNF